MIVFQSGIGAQAGASPMSLVLQGTPEGVEDNGSLTRVAAFPIGMDPEAFTKALTRPDVKSSIQQLLARYAGRKVCACLSSVWRMPTPEHV